MVRCAATTLKNRRCKAHAMIGKAFCRVHREDELCSVIEDPEQIVEQPVEEVKIAQMPTFTCSGCDESRCRQLAKKYAQLWLEKSMPGYLYMKAF